MLTILAKFLFNE